jgi:hypothetical protein
MMTSASLNCRSENVGIEPIVVAELKFRDVERHIFGAHLVERADNILPPGERWLLL